LVATPGKISPLNSSGPVGPPEWIETLWAVPASLLVNWIWNGVDAGAVALVWTYAMPEASIFTTTRAPDPAGAPDAVAEPDGAGPPEAGAPEPAGAGVVDGAGA
jgi:hypothetical protein